MPFSSNTSHKALVSMFMQHSDSPLAFIFQAFQGLSNKFPEIFEIYGNFHTEISWRPGTWKFYSTYLDFGSDNIEGKKFAPQMILRVDVFS